jgi:hypothetical protein
MTVNELILIVCLASVLINLALVGLTLKLYTEHFKDRSISRRSKL